ncbi:hypothetical protein HPB47_012986 [Ixodes persulcatus]|uniref:Uncharacterized protein n=1 Tax=Ixodes persulcatus TaxID=34615 RepID=A0AC60NS11_IXOPE|nr:hypothetical protein HPB47_012986 [Ixodes persulcatus]
MSLDALGFKLRLQSILRDALQGVLERRGLDLSGVDVILEYSKRPANLSHEALKFVGAQLRIKGVAELRLFPGPCKGGSRLPLCMLRER